MNPMVLLAGFIVLATGLASRIVHAETSAATSNDAALLVDWNQRILSMAIAEDKLLTLKGVRTAAMMHIAMHDAINRIEPRFTPFALRAPKMDASPIVAAPEVAAAEAAYTIALSQYPDQAAQLEQLRRRWVNDVPDNAARARAIRLGKAAATAILAARDGDGWDKEADYRWHPMGPGVYAEFDEHSKTPRGFVFGAGWALARPFNLLQPDQFRSPPPPAIDSPEYARAFNQVKSLGAYRSKERTADQDHIAMWWKDFVENSHNRLARKLVVERNTDLWTAARLFALLNTSIFDGYVASFENKFFYNHWRPYTAIRWAAHDGNPDTIADEEWNNMHRHTYPFPSYPSAHGTVCAAAMAVFEDTFGNPFAFAMETREVDSAGPQSEKIEMHPSTRSFDSFGEAAMQCAMSRVYLGIHFSYDSMAGVDLGRKVGTFAIDRKLVKLQ